jgi:hypothetical protein
LAVLAAAAAVALAALSPATAGATLLRLIDPFGHRLPQPKTELTLDAPRTRMGCNEAFELHGRVRGVVPPEAFLLVRADGLPETAYPIDVTPDGDKTAALSLRLAPGRLQHTFHFQVRANDALSPEYEVEVLPPPKLVALDGQASPQLRLFRPRYTGLPSPVPSPPGVGNIDEPFGVAVELRAAADRPLRAAWVEFRPAPEAEPGKPNPTLVALMLGPLGADHLAAAATLAVGGQAVWGRADAAIGDDRRAFAVHFTPYVKTGAYTLHFEDDTGLGADRLFDLRLRDDPAPTVQLTRPSKSRDLLRVLPTAELPLQFTVDDPLYGLRSAFLEYRFRPDGPAQRLPLFTPETAGSDLTGAWAGAAAHAVPPPLHLPHLEFRRTLPLKSLHRPDDSTLGDIIYLQACADDFDDVSTFKQPGRSEVVEIHVVDRDELDVVLTSEQTDVQQKLLRLREKERDALKRTADAERDLRRLEKLTLDEADVSEEAKKRRAELEKLRKDVDDAVRQGQQLQKEIQEGVGDRRGGLRAQANRIAEAVRMNDLANAGVRDRMDRVGKELDRLAENELQQIEPRLTEALKKAELLDKSGQAQRRTSLEDQARDLDWQAREADAEAKSRAADAERAERQAAAAADAAEKQRLADAAARQRKLAAELRERSGALRDEAARDRAGSANGPDPAGPRRELTQARKMQEEVEKTLDDLLTQMEAYSGVREVKGEAAQLGQEQRKLHAELEELEKKDPTLLGKDFDKLKPEQTAELKDLHDSQQRLERRMQDLLGKMQRMADERKASDPKSAEELKAGREQAVSGDVGGHMKKAAADIDQNHLQNAEKEQKAAADELQKMVRGFEEKHEEELDALAKQLKASHKELEELEKEQDELRKKIEEAAKKGDEAALAQLAKEQRRLEAKAKEMTEKLSKLGADRATKAAQRMQEAMAQDADTLEKGKKPEDDEAALERINDAKEEVDRGEQEAKDRLKQERQRRVADAVEALKSRQEALIPEAQRIRDALTRGAESSRALRGSLRGLVEVQKDLANDVDALARKELTSAPVFLKLLLRASEDMTEASRLFKEGDKADQPPVVDEEAIRRQQEAVHRLALVIDALKNDESALPPPAGKPGGPGGQGPGGDGDPPPSQADSIPPTAQLKVLRAMQKEVKERTEAFAKTHPDLTKLADKEKAELQHIRKAQQDIYDLLEEFRRPSEPAGGEGDKK